MFDIAKLIAKTRARSDRNMILTCLILFVFIISYSQYLVFSISKLDFHKRGEECGSVRPASLRNAVAIRRIDVGESSTASEPGRAGGHDDVFAQQRAINEPESQVVADLVTDVFLEQREFERLGVGEPQVVVVEEGAQFRRHVDVDARVEKPQTGVDEIGLPLKLAAAQGGYQAVRPDQLRAGLGQPDLLRIPEAEFAAGEIRVVHNRVEALRPVIERILVARSVEAGQAVTEEVEVYGKFDRAHLSVNALVAVGQSVKRVAPDHLIKRVRDVQPPEMPVAVYAEITRLNAVRNDGTESRRPHAQ